MRQSRTYTILFASIALLTFSSCGGSGDKKLSTANRLVEHLLSDFERLNPYNSTGANETYAEEMIFERLIACNPQTLEYDIPWLAESMPVESPDHMQFDFTLRKDIKWADGKPLTGEDVIFSLKALKNPYNVSSGQKRNYVDCIHSAELIDGDPYKVRFKLWKPYFLIKQSAFGDVLYILPKHIYDPEKLTDQYTWEDIAAIIEKSGNKEIDSSALAKVKANPAMQKFGIWMTQPELERSPKYIQGSGPYKLDQWNTNDFARLVRNPYYVNHWGKLGEANPDTLVYKTITSWEGAVTAIKRKDIDLIGSIQPAYYNQIDTTTGLKKTGFPLPAYTMIGWNNKSPFFSDVKVRWAMAHLIDRKTIIQKLLFGLAKPTQSSVFYGRSEFNPNLPEISYDPALAKAMLDSAGWKDHDGDGVLDKMINGKLTPFKFMFIVNSGNETRKQILLIITESLRKVGIQSDVLPLEWSVFLQRQRDHNFDARYGALIQDPFESDNYQVYHSSQATNRGSNYDNYMSPRADKLMEQIREELDDAKRKQLQMELQQVMYEEQPAAMLWVPDNLTIWVNRFDNVSFNSYRPGFRTSNWIIRGAGKTAKDVATN